MSIRLGPVCGPACGPVAESRLWAVRKNLGGTDGFGQLGTGMAKGGQCIWSWPGQVPGRETLQWMGLPETGPPAEHMYMRKLPDPKSQRGLSTEVAASRSQPR